MDKHHVITTSNLSYKTHGAAASLPTLKLLGHFYSGSKKITADITFSEAFVPKLQSNFYFSEFQNQSSFSYNINFNFPVEVMCRTHITYVKHYIPKLK